MEPPTPIKIHLAYARTNDRAGIAASIYVAVYQLGQLWDQAPPEARLFRCSSRPHYWPHKGYDRPIIGC